MLTRDQIYLYIYSVTLTTKKICEIKINGQHTGGIYACYSNSECVATEFSNDKQK